MKQHAFTFNSVREKQNVAGLNTSCLCNFLVALSFHLPANLCVVMPTQQLGEEKAGESESACMCVCVCVCVCLCVCVCVCV